MTRKNIISISEARKNIFKIAEEVQKPNKIYTLTEKGRPKVVLMSAEEFDSLMENLEILGDPKVMANIKKAEDEFKKGNYISLDEFKKELGYKESNSRLFLVADKSKKAYRAGSKAKIKKR